MDVQDNIIWKDIIGSKGYQVSNTGLVKRLEHTRWCVPNNSYSNMKEVIKVLSNNNTKKYWRVQIVQNDGTNKTESVHRLVAKAFIPNPLNKPQVNHKDGDRDNNNVLNLEWMTNQENMDHRYIVLRQFNIARKGSKCHFSKLKEEEVRKIADRIKNGEKLSLIAKDYPVGKTTLSELKAGRSWSHLGLFPYKKRKSEKYDKTELRYSPTTTEM